MYSQEYDVFRVSYEEQMQVNGKLKSKSKRSAPHSFLRLRCFRGIGIGRCGSNADLLKQLFTPHVVMVSSVSIIVIVMVTVGLSYYCYKLKTENRIEPSEDVGNLNGSRETL